MLSSAVGVTSVEVVSGSITGEGLPIPFSRAPVSDGSGTPVLIGLNRSYTAVAGTITWSVSGTDQAGCTHSGSGILTIAGGGIGGSGLTTWQGVMGGFTYRSYTGMIVADEQAPITITCPGIGSFDGFVLPAVVIASEPLPMVSSDGSRLQAVFSQGGSMFEWDFEVQQE